MACENVCGKLSVCLTDFYFFCLAIILSAQSVSDKLSESLVIVVYTPGANS